MNLKTDTEINELIKYTRWYGDNKIEIRSLKSPFDLTKGQREQHQQRVENQLLHIKQIN